MSGHQLGRSGGRRENSGRKVKCLCGRCETCKHKGSAWHRRFDEQPEPLGDELEHRMRAHFRRKGWNA